MNLSEITTSANIAKVPMPFIMVNKMPWPYAGKVLLPTFRGVSYVRLNKANRLQVSESTSKALKTSLEKKHGVKLSYSVSGDLMDLYSIVVPKDKRGQGLGSKVMKEIISWADQNDIIISLTPSGDLGSSVSRLKKFYSGLGFKLNKGRNKDFRTQNTMIRYPT